MTESCRKDYCQDGLRVFFATETKEYTAFPIYGHYELEPNYVKERPYFKQSSPGVHGIWWDGKNKWFIGPQWGKGRSLGAAYYDKDVFCGHQLSPQVSEGVWRILDENGWRTAENDLVITCKSIFIKKLYEIQILRSDIPTFFGKSQHL